MVVRWVSEPQAAGLQVRGQRKVAGHGHLHHLDAQLRRHVEHPGLAVELAVRDAHHARVGQQLVPAVHEGIAKAERSAADVDMLLEVKVSFDTDRARAMDDTRHWAALALTPEEKTGVEDPMEMEKLSDALPVERAARRWIVSDDPEEQVERIRPYVDMGFNHLVFHGPGPDQERFIRLYAERVLPLLRKHFG